MAFPLRLQIAVGDTLVAELIGDSEYVRTMSARWAQARYRRGLSGGGAVMQLAAKPRIWDVPIGGRIPSAREAFQRAHVCTEDCALMTCSSCARNGLARCGVTCEHFQFDEMSALVAVDDNRNSAASAGEAASAPTFAEAR